MRVTVTASPGTRAMLARLGPETARAAVAEGVRDWAAVLDREVKMRTPGTGPGRTGDLRRAWQTRVEQTSPDSIDVSIENPKPHAAFVEYGTGIYGPTGQRIKPKVKKALAFHWGKGNAAATRSAQAPSAFRVGAARLAARAATKMVRRSVAGMKPQRPFATGFHLAAERWAEIVGRRVEQFILGGRG